MISSRTINILVPLLFIGMWFSVGSNPENFLNILFERDKISSNLAGLNLSVLINFLRSIFPLFCLLICLIIIIKYKLFFNQNNYLNILLLIQIAQFISTFLSQNTFISDYENMTDHIGRYHWIISSISTIFIFMIANKLQNFKTYNLFFISIIFLVLIVVFFSSKILLDFFNPDINSNNVSIYNLHVWRETAYFFNHEIPRVTGISRSICILLIILMFINFKNNNIFKLIKYPSIIVCGSLIFLFQSKFAVIFYLIINLFFLFNSKNKIGGLKKIVILFLLQVFLFFSISEIKYHFIDQKIKDGMSKIEKVENKKKFGQKHLRTINKKRDKDFSILNDILMSGRLKLWTDSFKQIKKKPILGYGSMSDRIVINEKRLASKGILNPVSNAFIYSLISGGLISLSLFIFFLITIREKFINLMSFSTLNSNEVKIGSLILLMILLRIMVENSIMLFGIDFILLLNSLNLVERK